MACVAGFTPACVRQAVSGHVWPIALALPSLTPALRLIFW